MGCDNNDMDRRFEGQSKVETLDRPEPWPSPPVTSPPSRVETVNHPAHYGGDTTYEIIKVIRAWNLGFALGSAVKYIGRNPIQKVQALQQGSYEKLEEAQRKARAQRIDDLKKAVWYIQNEIKELENENR